MIAFDEFRRNVRDAEAKGIFKTSIPLTDYDLAVQWAISRVGEKKGGYPCDMTAEEIWAELPQEFKVAEQTEPQTDCSWK